MTWTETNALFFNVSDEAFRNKTQIYFSRMLVTRNTFNDIDFWNQCYKTFFCVTDEEKKVL
jgi:hypothetical protein